VFVQNASALLIVEGQREGEEMRSRFQSKASLACAGCALVVVVGGCESNRSAQTSAPITSAASSATPKETAPNPFEKVPPASDFTAKVDNPWYPLRPGTTLVYEGGEGGNAERNVFKVTQRTKVVNGARCVVIDDRVYSGPGAGHVSERTSDYYAQDSKGNVWYFGEDTAALDSNGNVKSTAGTWHAGVNGARAGLFMPAHPRVGETHRQEYLKGHAEDWFKVLSLNAKVNVPHGRYTNALRTREWTPLEPGVIDNKYYAHGIGEVFEGTVKGGNERFELVAVTHSKAR
jgi:hypothetical protein